MFIPLKYLFFAIALIVSLQTASGQQSDPTYTPIHDEYCLDTIDALYVKNPDLALVRIDSLRRRCKTNKWTECSQARLEIINSLIYLYKENPAGTLRHAYIVLSVTENLSKENVFWRLMALQYISLAYSSSENWFMTARTVHQMEELAQGRDGYAWYESVALMIRSQMLARQQQVDQAIQLLAKAQSVMRRDTTKRGRIIAAQNYLDTERFKAGIYATAKRYNESKAHHQNVLQFIETVDSTVINRSLYDLTRLRTHALLCEICEQLGQKKEAAHHYDQVRLLQTEYQEGHGLTAPLAGYLLLSERYDELDSMIAPILHKATLDKVVTQQIAQYIKQYIQMLNKRGQFAQSAQWGERYIEINDSLHTQVTQRAMDEFVVAYEVKEQEAEILAQKHELLHHRVWTIALIIFASLLILGITLTFYLLCRQRRNNRFLFEQIKETNKAFAQLTRFAITPSSTAPTADDNTMCENQRTTRDVSDYLLDGDRFLNKELSLNNIVHHCAISHDTLNNRLNAIINMSLSKYITMLRLDHSCKLLSDTNLTIDAVADDSGFSSTRTFLRQFKGKYNLSPTQYRKQHKTS